ncbi:MAG: chorismate-binding protein [Desulfosarcina sp.]|nr:chorismate-binding protein [Desulfobacterales bacterium]
MFIQRFPDIAEFRRLAEKHNVIPVCVEILADTETPVSILKKLYDNDGPVFLFESVEGGERWGRYSFIGASARCKIKIYSTFVEIEEKGSPKHIPHYGDPLSILRNFMKRFVPADVPGLPRFWGGMVGYLTYEMVSFFEKIPNNMPEDKPLANFIIPDELLIFDNIHNTLMGLSVVFLERNYTRDEIDTLFKSANERITSIFDIINHSQQEEYEYPESKDYSLNAVKVDDEYRGYVKKVKEYILAGDVIQTVIAQPFASSDTPDLWHLYRAQRYINPSPYLYFMHIDDMALVGSSPETMVRLEDGTANLRPIAGTRPRGSDKKEDDNLAEELLADEKERAEHLMLVDLGRNDLGRVAQTGTVNVTDLMIVERYSHVMHIVSNITCKLKQNCDAWDLIKATFPAGTLSGAPKVRAMEIISELEDEPRGPYGGAVGYISFNGNMDLAITIRTACIENGRLTVKAGAGIVYDSDPEKERVETVNKAMSIQKALQLLKYGSGRMDQGSEKL